jgi:hypothetical protein
VALMERSDTTGPHAACQGDLTWGMLPSQCACNWIESAG